MLLFGKENKVFFKNRRLRFLTGLLGTNHYGQQVRMNRLWKISSDKLDGTKKILEAGAYKADFSFRAVTEKKCYADLVEIDKHLCEQIEKKFAVVAHNLFCLDIETFQPAEKYDCIFLVDVCQYLYSPSATIINLMDNLKGKGFLFFTLPDILADTNQGYFNELVKNTEKRLSILAAIAEKKGYILHTNSIYSKLDEKLETIHKKIKSINFTLALVCLPLLLMVGLLLNKDGSKVYVVECIE
jgi:hypothetical protein